MFQSVYGFKKPSLSKLTQYITIFHKWLKKKKSTSNKDAKTHSWKETLTEIIIIKKSRIQNGA